jgi:hypothetical protein
VRVSPRLVYADASDPGLVAGFAHRTFTAMIEGVRDAALAARLLDAAGVRAPHRTAEPDGVAERRAGQFGGDVPRTVA